MGTDSTYKKYIYWLKGPEEARLREELARQGKKMRTAKGIVCSPLDELNKISSVAPSVWDETCARQGSWYRTSDKNGMYLIISSFELQGYDKKKSAIITVSDFEPPRPALMEEKDILIHDPGFMKRMPDQWLKATESEKKVFMHWASRMGSDVKDFQTLFITHSANHANFMNPLLFIRANEDIIPYSIDRTTYLCSCCLELFQVIGKQFSKKLVAPCPGAALFARLEPDRFLLVEGVTR